MIAEGLQLSARIEARFEEMKAGDALGPLLPMYSHGHQINFEDPGDDDTFGVGQSLAWQHTRVRCVTTKNGGKAAAPGRRVWSSPRP